VRKAVLMCLNWRPDSRHRVSAASRQRLSFGKPALPYTIAA
jgi:hypothetical protein